MKSKRPNGLVLAASRRKTEDSVARLQGKSHKCLVEIDGIIMIERVIDAMLKSDCLEHIYVSIEDEKYLRCVPNIAHWIDEGLVSAVKSKGNLADSVLYAIEQMKSRLPVVITTGDNALHTPDIVADFTAQFLSSTGDVAAGFTTQACVEEEFAESGLAFHQLKDGGFSSCNLYGLRTEKALKTVKIFEGGGQFGKRHMRILKAFGILPFIIYKLKLTNFKGLMDRIGKNLGVNVDTILLDYPWGPIDVDNPFSFKLTEDTLIRRRTKQG